MAILTGWRRNYDRKIMGVIIIFNNNINNNTLLSRTCTVWLTVYN